MDLLFILLGVVEPSLQKEYTLRSHWQLLFSAGKVAGENAKWIHQNKAANNCLYSTSQTNGVYGYLGMSTYYRYQVNTTLPALRWLLAGTSFILGIWCMFPCWDQAPACGSMCLSDEQLCSPSPGLTSALLLWIPEHKSTLSSGMLWRQEIFEQAITWETM